MSTTPCSERVFPFRLAFWLPTSYASYLHWLSHLLERLGRDCTLSAWHTACQIYEDTLLFQILNTGWKETDRADALSAEASITELFPKFFSTAIDGVSRETARQLVEQMPPIKQVRQAFPTLNAWREITAYEALHLRSHGLALLAEALIRLHGKQGELIVYDVLREERLQTAGDKTGSVAELISSFTQAPDEANMFTAGLEIEIAHMTEAELRCTSRNASGRDIFGNVIRRWDISWLAARTRRLIELSTRTFGCDAHPPGWRERRYVISESMRLARRLIANNIAAQHAVAGDRPSRCSGRRLNRHVGCARQQSYNSDIRGGDGRDERHQQA